jgi:hypothetical protein
MAADMTYTVKKTSVFGDLRVVMGTYTNASGSTGGAIVTGLNEVLFFTNNYQTSQATTVNLISISGGTVTMTTVDNEDGQWLAIGV